jgi:hypothetical protein
MELQSAYCDGDCDGYYVDPRPGSLWPGESETDFGYTVGSDATEERFNRIDETLHLREVTV